MEERLACLETALEHIQSDVREIKARVSQRDGKSDGVGSSLENKLDKFQHSLEDKLDEFQHSLESKLDGINASLESLKRGRLEDRLWALFAMATLLGVLARGFHWI